jgi:hypothetical protein
VNHEQILAPRLEVDKSATIYLKEYCRLLLAP